MLFYDLIITTAYLKTLYWQMT